jgi:hypothetical protein
MTEVGEILKVLLSGKRELTDTITDEIAADLSSISRTIPFNGFPSKKVGMCLEYVASLAVVKTANSFPFFFSS